jgi:hypothetical protein
LVAAQAALRPVGKDAKNPAFRSKYASLDAIMEAVRPTLAAHGLAVTQGVVHPETGDGGKLVGITVETRLLHASGEWMTSVTPVPVAKADAHGLGSALSYGRRYGVSALLALSTDEDDDGNAAALQTSRPVSPTSKPTQQESHAAPEPNKRLHESVPETPAEKMPLAKAEAATIKGQRLGEMDDEHLLKLGEWARVKGNNFIAAACATLLEARRALDIADGPEPDLLSDSLPF